MVGAPPPPPGAAGLYLHFPFCAIRCSYCDFPTVVGRDDRIEAYLAALLLEIRRFQRDLPRELGHRLSGGRDTLQAEPATVGLRSGGRARRVPAPRRHRDHGRVQPREPRTRQAGRLPRGRRDAVEHRRPVARRRRAARGRPRPRCGPRGAGRRLRARGSGASRSAPTSSPACPARRSIAGSGRSRPSPAGASTTCPSTCWRATRTPRSRLPSVGERRPSPTTTCWRAPTRSRSGRWPAAGTRSTRSRTSPRAGHVSRHNLKYWTDGWFGGFGLGAHAYFGGTRRSNTKSLDDYLTAIHEGRDPRCPRGALGCAPSVGGGGHLRTAHRHGARPRRSHAALRDRRAQRVP